MASGFPKFRRNLVHGLRSHRAVRVDDPATAAAPKVDIARKSRRFMGVILVNGAMGQ